VARPEVRREARVEHIRLARVVAAQRAEDAGPERLVLVERRQMLRKKCDDELSSSRAKSCRQAFIPQTKKDKRLTWHFSFSSIRSYYALTKTILTPSNITYP
jgi:hypothetical protein